jgi:Heterokaryon incompatibility protein (HET)
MALQTSAQTEHSIYTPIDKSTSQIRLLYLQPRLSPTLNNIICSLHLADLDDQTCQYEALSYEWGDADSISSYWIELDGGKRAVRDNLWWALWYLRDEKVIRVVWIDALCIDQDNEGEKNYQVSEL